MYDILIRVKCACDINIVETLCSRSFSHIIMLLCIAMTKTVVGYNNIMTVSYSNEIRTRYYYNIIYILLYAYVVSTVHGICKISSSFERRRSTDNNVRV